MWNAHHPLTKINPALGQCCQRTRKNRYIIELKAIKLPQTSLLDCWALSEAATKLKKSKALEIIQKKPINGSINSLVSLPDGRKIQPPTLLSL